MKKEKLNLKIKNYPNFNQERKCWKRGYCVVTGLDEAGRGPLAGPVVASAIYIASAKLKIPEAEQVRYRAGKNKKLKIKDSKKLTPKQREKWYQILTKHPDIKWGIGVVSEKIIDKINIFEATKLAMKKAIEKLKIKNKKLKIDYLILDGNIKLDLPLSQKSVIRADEKVFSCAAASIIAKVTRDRIMIKYAKKYPEYGFERHKGYGTREHFKLLKKYGRCAIHRQSFKPIKSLPK